MRLLGKKVLCAVFAICMLSSLLCTSATAVTDRSSAYLDGYRAVVTAKSGGRIVVTVDVSGVGRMTKIGATTIYIYESEDNKSFFQVAEYNYEDYPKMMRSNVTTYYDDAVTYYGTPGNYYFASVYCYAENADGSDEKNYTTSIKRAIS